MKCPKCGFVSYPGLAQCRKCGHTFQTASPPELSSSELRLFPESQAPESQPAGEESLPPLPRAEMPEFLRTKPESEGTSAPTPPRAPEAATTSPQQEQRWKEELSERVENYRRRRAQAQPETEAEGNLDFNAETDGQNGAEGRVLEFPPDGASLDLELGHATKSEGKKPNLEGLPLEKRERAPISTASVGEVTLGSAAPEGRPVEIVIGPPKSAATLAATTESEVVPVAPLGRRLLAGLADTGVLLLGAILFSLIFWRAGGHLSSQPLNLAVLAFIAVFFVFVYFALSITFAASTPGLLWLGIEVRNLDGLPPTPREALWRAFGYLVSIAALMLGFVWALVDSESLTWHDRMSGTYLVPVGGGISLEESSRKGDFEGEGLKVKGRELSKRF